MIYPGTDLKFRVTTEIAGFDIDSDDFRITILGRRGHERCTIQKEECFQDSEGRWYFTFEKPRSGWYFARFAAALPDFDYEKNTRVITDEQPLCIVGYCERHAPRVFDCNAEGHQVHYEQVWTVNAADGCYLVDCDGNPILDADGNYIYLSDPAPSSAGVRINMTSEEFKHWMDDKDQNGTIDTRREMEDALRGIGDDTELTPMTAEEAHNIANEIFNN